MYTRFSFCNEKKYNLPEIKIESSYLQIKLIKNEVVRIGYDDEDTLIINDLVKLIKNKNPINSMFYDEYPGEIKLSYEGGLNPKKVEEFIIKVYEGYEQQLEKQSQDNFNKTLCLLNQEELSKLIKSNIILVFYPPPPPLYPHN